MSQQETIPQIRSDIERSKQDMARTAHEIEYRVEEMKDWRTAVNKYPFAAVGASVALGLLATGALPGIVRSTAYEVGPVVKSGLVALVMDIIRGD